MQKAPGSILGPFRLNLGKYEFSLKKKALSIFCRNDGLLDSRTDSDFIGHSAGRGSKKIENLVKPKPEPYKNSINVKKNSYSIGEKRRNTKRFKTNIMEWNTTKHLNF